MNKLFTKIATLALGATMAIGVGVAVASSKDAKETQAVSYTWQKVTATSEFVNGTEILITQGSYYLNVSATSTSQTPRLASLTLSNNLPTLTANNTECFLVSGSGSSIKLCKATDTSKWLITGSSNNAARINTGTTGQYWSISSAGTNEFYLRSNSGSRYLSRYGTTDFRSYTNSGTNANLVLYKLVESKTTQTITGSTSGTAGTGVSLSTNATSSTSWTITANTCGATLSASTGKSITVNATGAGSVTVKATDTGYTDATHTITFSAAATPTLSFDKASISGYTGQQISVTATFANLESDLAWSASGTGSITGGNITWSSSDHRNGTSTYTCTLSGEGGKTIVADADGVDAAQCVVTINQTTVDITKASTSIAQGKSETLAASHNASSVGGLNWTSSNDSVATVGSDGKVTVAAGATVGVTVTITATSSVDTSVSDTCTVTVLEAPLEYEIVFGTAEGTSGITDFSNSSYVIPSGVTLNNIQGNVYSNTSNQAASLRFGKSGTTGSFDATISGNYYITSVVCNLKYYGSDSTATFAVTPSGGSAISKSLTASWEDYTYDVSAAKTKTVTLGTDVNGKRAYLSGFTINYAALKTLSNITLSGTYPTSFTKGDTFSHAGMVVTANYSDSTSATVTGSATWSTPDMSTPGAKTITVSYSDEYGSVSTTYSITVNYANPTGITLSLYSKKLALLEEFDVADVDVTINPSGTANQSEYEWVVYDEDGLVENDTYVFSDGVFYAMEAADAVVLRCQSTKAGYAATVYADVTVEITGNPIVTLYNASDDDKTNGSESVFTDAGDITYHVAAENFSGTLTYSWNTSASAIISKKTENNTSCVFHVEGGEGSARLSCRVQDTASHDITVYIDVTVEAWSVTSVSWTAPTINVYSGATLTSSDVSGWNVKYSTNSGKTNQTAELASIIVKLGGSTISLPHTWVATDDGKELGVEYGGILSSTTTVAVTQSLRPVMAPVPGESETSTLTFTAACEGSGTSDGGEEWTITSDGAESTYDPTKGIHYGTGSAAVQYINLKSSDFTTGKITSVVVNASTASGVTATVAVNVGGNAFGGAAKSLSQTATEYTFEGEVDAGEIEVIITKPSSAAKAIYCKSIAVTYATDSGEEINIANVAGHEAAQRAVVKFAKAFNTAMDTTSECTTNMSSAWSTASSAWTAFLSEAAALGETEEAYAKSLIKNASAQWTKNTDEDYDYCLERALATYEKCVTVHGQTKFMEAVRPVASNVVISPLFARSNASSTAVIVVISMVTLVAVGGYFFIRRKQN